MITFKRKEFSEYENMRVLYNEIQRNFYLKNKIRMIDPSALPSILRGNNVVIEKFSIITSLFNKDRYVMYLKMGAKVKLPDKIRLDGDNVKENIGSMSIKFKSGIPKFNSGSSEKKFSDTYETRIFGGGKDNGKKKKKGDGGFINAEFTPYENLSYDYTRLVGRVVKYNKIERSLVLEFDSKMDALKALDILPFGLDYNLYLLNS
jgi:hypothetical protein